MSLTECPECGKSVASDADQCLNCGHNFARQRQRQLDYLTYGAAATFVLLVVLIGVSIYVAWPTAEPRRQRPALIEHARTGNVDRVESLLKDDADPNIRDARNRTVLQIAVEQQHDGIVKVLLDHGAHPDPRSERNRTPLHGAAERGDTLVLRVLIRGGAPVDLADDRGNTPLIEAVRNGRGEATRRLLDAGADPDHQNDRGQTALMLAAGQGNRELINLLVRRGARTDLEDETGKTAADRARENGYIMEARSLD